MSAQIAAFPRHRIVRDRLEVAATAADVASGRVQALLQRVAAGDPGAVGYLPGACADLVGACRDETQAAVAVARGLARHACPTLGDDPAEVVVTFNGQTRFFKAYADLQAEVLEDCRGEITARVRAAYETGLGRRGLHLRRLGLLASFVASLALWGVIVLVGRVVL